MNETLYSDVLDKARASLAEKKISETRIRFDDIRVSFLTEKAFWFISGVKRKLMRRLGK